MNFPSKQDSFFSMTKYTTFEACGYKYAFRYRKGIQEPKNKYLVAGIATHNALEWALNEFNNGITHTIADIRQRAVQSLIPQLNGLINEHKQDAVDIVDKSLATYNPYALFRPGMAAEATLRPTYKDINLMIKADVLYQQEGSKTLLIGDYKTSSAFHKTDIIFQASLYHHGTKLLLPDVNPKFAAIMLRLNKIYTVEPWPEDKFWAYVTYLTEEIRKENWTPNTKSCHAFNSPCPYSHICPYYR